MTNGRYVSPTGTSDPSEEVSVMLMRYLLLWEQLSSMAGGICHL